METLIRVNDQIEQSQQTQSSRWWEIRRHEEGWKIHSSSEGFQLSGDRQALESILERVLMDSRYTLFLDQEGRLETVEGFEDLKERLSKAIPGELGESAEMLFNEANQRWRVKNDWENEYGFWEPGQALAAGTSWEIERELTPPAGPAMHSKRHYSLQSIKQEGDKTLAVVAFQGRAQTLQAEDASVPSLIFTEGGTYTFDLRTGFLSKGEWTRQLDLTLPMESGEPMRQTRLEKRRFHYEKE